MNEAEFSDEDSDHGAQTNQAKRASIVNNDDLTLKSGASDRRHYQQDMNINSF